MEYTVQELAKLVGITPRTLRYYDEIGLLKPARSDSSGYRIYGGKEIDRLQQIMFYRELGVSLNQIREIITSPTFNKVAALQEHHAKLLERKNQLELLIDNVEKTLAMTERRTTMSDKEKFAGFKEKLLTENELKYGREIREKFGEESVNSSYEKVRKPCCCS